MNGLLYIDKPKGWTSFDVVAKLRSVARQTPEMLAATTQDGKRRKLKIGHTGTLDPMATGLLVIAVGTYTKKVPELTKRDKVYEAVITLGSRSTTDDAEGDKSPVSDREPDSKEVKQVLATFLGEQSQIPPQFSAIKVGGVRAYAQARKGAAVELKPRLVHVYDIEVLDYSYPHISCRMHVGSGTYIRSIARDVGEKLGCGAYLSELRRTKIGEISIREARAVSEVTPECFAQLLHA